MRAQALALMGLSAEDWGPCVGDEFAHADFAAKWRGGAECPSESAINAAFDADAGQRARRVLLAQIAALEALETHRRLREAALGIDGGWMAAHDAEIAALRAQL